MLSQGCMYIFGQLLIKHNLATLFAAAIALCDLWSRFASFVLRTNEIESRRARFLLNVRSGKMPPRVC
jgi:hypothetical protein